MGEDRSWIKLHRALSDSPIMRNPLLLQVWIHLLINANWKSSRYKIPGTTHEIDVPRGSLISGRNALHSKLYPDRDEHGITIRDGNAPTPMTLWRKLQFLEAISCVKIETMFNRCSVITVINYESYQNVNDQDVPLSVQLGVHLPVPPGVPQPDTSKEFKEGKELKKKDKEPRAAFVSPTVNEIAVFCAKRNNSVDAQQFFDHYESNGWMVGRVKMKDWQATVRNWEKRKFGNVEKVTLKPRALTSEELKRVTLADIQGRNDD